MIVLSVLTKISISLWASSIVFSEVLGWDRHAVLWIVGAVTALYTMKGGLRAVVYTDAIQTAILLVAAAILTFTGLSHVGGWEALHARLPSEMFSTIAPATHPDVPWPGMFIGVFLIGSFYWCMDQVLVQRVFAARDVNEGRLGAIFCAFLKLSTPFLLVLPGLIAKALFPDLTVADRAYPLLLTTLLPHGLLGLTVAGIAAALMGHLSATYNSVATLVTRDFYLKRRPAAPQPAQVKAGRITVAVVFLLGALWAPIIGGFPSLWIYLQSVGAYLMMPFVAVFYFGVLWRRTTTAGVYASAITGFIAGPALMIDNRLHFIRALDTPLLRPWLHTAIIEFLLCALALVLVSLVTTPVSDEKLAATTIGRFTDQSPRGLADYRLWLAAVLALVTLLWFWTR
jgi:SSS family solute:Na+ symporter